VGSPYVAYDDAVQPLEFSAVIRVTGERSGTVCFSVSRAMLTIMLMRMGATDITHDSMCRLLGEFTSHIASAARRDIGGDFVVRDPVVRNPVVRDPMLARHARTRATASGDRALVAPIQWRKFTAKMTLCMD
jgi:chemotaxis protein CheX